MHCASCVARVESAMAGVPGVLAARVNLATQRAEADVAANGQASADLATQLTAAVRGAGYDAFPVTSPVAEDRERRECEHEERVGRERFLRAVTLGGAVLLS